MCRSCGQRSSFWRRSSGSVRNSPSDHFQAERGPTLGLTAWVTRVERSCTTSRSGVSAAGPETLAGATMLYAFGISALLGSVLSMTLRACSAPVTGRPFGSSRPTCTRTDA
jgi:hypothetical protein